MANVTAKMVKELRDSTGAGMLDCKKALVEADGNMDKAVDILREKGLSKAAKKAEDVYKRQNVDSAFYYIKDEKLKYICAVVLTDGYFPKPNVLIRNVIWCLTEDATTKNIEGYKGSKIINM